MGSLCLFRQQRGLRNLLRSAVLQATIVLLFGTIVMARDQYAQETLERKVTISLKNVTLEKALIEIEKAAQVKFVYSRSRVKVNVIVSVEATDQKLAEVLKELLATRGIDFSSQEGKNQILLFLQADGPPKTGSELLEPVPDNQLKQEFRAGITGTVHDAATQQPLPGVNVIVRGTTNGTSTNADGNYSLVAAENDILVFSFIGYKPFETNVAGRILIDISLESDVTALKEVVINAGYYDVQEKEKTGSISKVTSDVIEKQPVTNPLGALQGRMPGVYIQQASGTPGADFRIQIRGRNSLRSEGNEPLYIIDGVFFSTEKTFSHLVSGATFGTTGNDNGVAQISPLSALNPSDIESIEILKDADATSIYGSRGANGVVLITTKKGKAGKTQFDLNVYSGVGHARRVNLLSTKDYLKFRRQAFSNDGLIPSANPADPGYAPDLMIWDTTKYTDWQKVFLGAAQTTSVQSSLSGGSQQTQFLFSLGYRRENSIYPGNLGYQKGSFHLSINHQSSNKKLSFSSNINGAKDKNDQPATGLASTARSLAPNAPDLYDANGKLNWENSTWQNPLGEAEMKYSNDVINLTANATAGYEIVKDLQFKTSFGINYFSSGERLEKPSTFYDPALGYTSAQSGVSVSNGTNQSWSIEPQVNWNKKISYGQMTVLTGSTFLEQRLKKNTVFYRGFPSDALMSNLGSASFTMNQEYVESLYRYMAIFGRINYNWKEKYIVNFTGRRDGSSRFGPDKRFGNFWAIGSAWLFSNESFIGKNLSFLSFGKLRFSYGVTGNDQIGNYQYLDTYSPGASGTLDGNQYQGITWLRPDKLFNPSYAWEVNKKLEAAIELTFLKDRISFNMNYFRNRSSNQLVSYTLPGATGFTGVLANLPATVQNTGVEIESSSVNIRTENFQWSTSFNLTIPRNKLLSFPNLEASSYASTYVVGKPLYVAKLYESTGVDPTTGIWTFRDVNDDGVISSPQDNTKVHFVGQTFYGGFNNSFSFKGVSFDIFFQFVKQTGIDQFGLVVPGFLYNTYSYYTEESIWRQEGDKAKFQRLYVRNAAASVAYENYKRSDASVTDASFIRLKNVSFSYQLSEKWLKNVKCRIYLQGQNLLLITKYKADDPEVLRSGSLAPLKFFTAGFQLTL